MRNQPGQILLKEWDAKADRELIRHIQAATVPVAAAGEMGRPVEDLVLRALEMGMRLRGWRGAGKALMKSLKSSKPLSNRFHAVLLAEWNTHGTLEHLAAWLSESVLPLRLVLGEDPAPSRWDKEMGLQLLQMAQKGRFSGVKALAEEWSVPLVEVLTRANAMSMAVDTQHPWSPVAVKKLIKGDEDPWVFAQDFGVPEKDVRHRDAVLAHALIRPSMDAGVPGRGGRPRGSVSLGRLNSRAAARSEMDGMSSEERREYLAHLLKGLVPIMGTREASDVLGITVREAKGLWDDMVAAGKANPEKALRKPDPMSAPEVAAVRSLIKDKQSVETIAKFLRRDVEWVRQWLKERKMID